MPDEYIFYLVSGITLLLFILKGIQMLKEPIVDEPLSKEVDYTELWRKKGMKWSDEKKRWVKNDVKVKKINRITISSLAFYIPAILITIYFSPNLIDFFAFLWFGITHSFTWFNLSYIVFGPLFSIFLILTVVSPGYLSVVGYKKFSEKNIVLGNKLFIWVATIVSMIVIPLIFALLLGLIGPNILSEFSIWMN